MKSPHDNGSERSHRHVRLAKNKMRAICFLNGVFFSFFFAFNRVASAISTKIVNILVEKRDASFANELKDVKFS
jgi:hypothetical protein